MDSRLIRVDSNRLNITNPHNIPATLFANEQVQVERAAVDELFTLLELVDTVNNISKENSLPDSAKIDQIAITPDFHKAAGIPVGTVMATSGFVVPQAIGNDINCGMRLHTTSLTVENIKSHSDDIETALRHAYFEGGRDIAMTGLQREAMFCKGLEGLLDSAPPEKNSTGLWNTMHRHRVGCDLSHVEQRGSMTATRTYGLNDFIGDPKRSTRDSQIGSIGGGNHFVEIQYVERVIDRHIAHAWGLSQGTVTIMAHSGSVSIGHLCGTVFCDKVREIYPKKLKHPNNGIFILPCDDQASSNLFWDCLANAANFAFANRLFLALIAIEQLEKTVDDFDTKLLYDAPHNLVWRDKNDKNRFIHRKGATTARGYEAMENTPFAYYGEPVLVPGSMGDSSYVLCGLGNQEALESASHGAGRVLSRGEAAHGYDKEFSEFLDAFRVVTPLDLRRRDLQSRPDIVAKKLADLKGEGPHAYKGIGPIIKTLEAAGIAKPVVELRPLITVKG